MKALSLWHGRIEVPDRSSMTAIAALIAERYGLSVCRLKGPERQRRVSWPRQEAMWLMRKYTTRSLPQIGRFLGGRDHTTVLHGVRAYQARLTA